jgi:soluble lytic murein transglycosylase
LNSSSNTAFLGIVTGLLLIVSLGSNIYQFRSFKDKTETLKLEGILKEKTLKLKLDALKEKDLIYTLRDQRMQCMVKTLITVYDLSKWEAHYYSIIFDDFSQKFNIPWEIYPAVIQTESKFKCNVVSPKGAKGLMQLIEPTGELIASEIDMNYIKGLTLWNDFCNLNLGCYYLSKSIKEQGLDGGVCSYLGGPSHLKNARISTGIVKELKTYKTTVGKEYKTLLYIYQGIISESGFNYKELHTFPYSDSIIIDIDLFSTIK